MVSLLTVAPLAARVKGRRALPVCVALDAKPRRVENNLNSPWKPREFHAEALRLFSFLGGVPRACSAQSQRPRLRASIRPLTQKRPAQSRLPCEKSPRLGAVTGKRRRPSRAVVGD